MGNLYEVLILRRLEEEIAKTGRLSEEQFEFRKGRSTIESIHKAVHTIIKTGANWQIIVGKLRTRAVNGSLIRLLCDYFRDWVLQVCPYYDMEIPQGSILGPMLLNMLYDDVLRLEIPINTSLIAYADAAVVVSDDTEKDMVEKESITMQKNRPLAAGMRARFGTGENKCYIF